MGISPSSPPQEDHLRPPRESLQLEFFDEQDNNPLPDSYSQVLGPLSSPRMAKGSYGFDSYSPNTRPHTARNPESMTDVGIDGE